MPITSKLKSIAMVVMKDRHPWVPFHPHNTIPIEHHPIDASLDAGPIHNIKVYNDIILWPSQSIAANKNGKIFQTLIIDEWQKEVDRYLYRWPALKISVPCTSIDFVWSGQNHFHQMVDCHSRLLALQQITPFPHLRLLLPRRYSEKYIPLMKYLCPWIEPMLVPNHLRFRCKTYLHLPQLSAPIKQKASKGVGKFSGLSEQFFRLHQNFISHIPRESKRLIYVTRQGAKHRRILNEGDLINLITRKGGEVVRLENMSIEEQLAMFRDSRIIVAPHGAAMANLLATHGKTTYLELLPCKIEQTPDYFGRVGNTFFKHFALEGSASGIHDDFHINLQQLEALLARLIFDDAIESDLIDID